MDATCSSTGAERQREDPAARTHIQTDRQTDRQTHARKLVRLHAQLVHRERAAILWRNPRQTLPQAGFQLLSITATLTAR